MWTMEERDGYFYALKNGRDWAKSTNRQIIVAFIAQRADIYTQQLSLF